MIKRLFDLTISVLGLALLLPLLLPVLIIVWLRDFHSPLYVAERVGKDGKTFRMFKIRTMLINADRSGVDSTSVSDPRITEVGRFLRRFKLDEIPQLINVIKGDMSLVGPRPNVRRETDLYTSEERRLLEVRPGITDLASIVFADEGEILKGREDPDLAYNQLIRPWKSRLGILYAGNSGFHIDLRILFLTALALISRKKAMIRLEQGLRELNADPLLLKVASRTEPLLPYPPPGAEQIVMSRN
jgi:lipopolysaccharide/colanic/teichoic acid biosynthesis glycosyltransferase